MNYSANRLILGSDVLLSRKTEREIKDIYAAFSESTSLVISGKQHPL
jgi:hypothetical protein